MVAISVVEADILKRPCDLIILKQAVRFHGVDKVVSGIVEHHDRLPNGQFALVPGGGLAARQVMFIGVGILRQFRYPQIRAFAAQALALARDETPDVRKICMPVHGPGYGLDESESFLSLLAGIADGINSGAHPAGLEAIEIVEVNPQRATRFAALLQETLKTTSTPDMRSGVASRGEGGALDFLPAKVQRELAEYGERSEEKVRLFVAMPFDEAFIDEWEVAISDAGRAADMICERMDREAFVGDIVEEIRVRIESYGGFLALLNGGNPNVFFELGYALAKGKPAVLMVKKGEPLPFDISSHRCIVYANISDLRKKLTEELIKLKHRGVFRREEQRH